MTARSFFSRSIFLAAVAAVLPQLAAAQASPPESVVPPLKVIDPAFIDRSANACNDFFLFANGAWLAKDTIPAAYSSTGVSRDMSDRNELVVRSVLDDAMANRRSLPANSTKRKLGTFYATCMDSASAEKAGVAPIRPTLASIAAISSKRALLTKIAELQTTGSNVAFRFGPDVDAHDSKHYVAALDRGGLGLPDRDYYLKPGAAADSMRAAYVDHIAKVFTLAGTNAATARSDAQKIMGLETEMAKASLTRVARRDPSATDHPMSTDSLKKIAPAIDWPTYFRNVGLTKPVTRVNTAEPAFFARISTLIDSVPLSTWKAYLEYHELSSASPWLSSPFVNEAFAFNARFSGAKQLLPRWKRCLRVTDALVGEALGAAYVEKTFPPAAREKAKAVIDDIRSAFAGRIKKLDWMSDSTKAHALDKLAKMREKIGYPDAWRDYSKLTVADGPFVNNVSRAATFAWQRVANRPGMPVDTTEWGMTVPTVNAYYNPAKNEMVFPAGALSPQTFDATADDAANYGSLGGSWAGHELTHGFDDEGRHYDAAGNLRDWWAPSDSVVFSREATVVADQFSGYVAVDTLHVNGRLTLGENLADYGGLLTAYDALQKALARDGRPGLIDDFTPEQRFFIAYAQSWRSHRRPEAIRSQLAVDPHAPEAWRANGPLMNMPQFATAFGCKPGDPMVRPANLIPKIW
jgi:putative endopeptidase